MNFWTLYTDEDTDEDIWLLKPDKNVIPNYKKHVRPVQVELFEHLTNLHIFSNSHSFIGSYQYSNNFTFAYPSGLICII